MTPTNGIIPHRLIPHVSGVPDDAENLSVMNTNAGGFGTADWDQASAPSLAKGEPIKIDVEGRLFEGKVEAITGGIGETLSWHVSCVGHFDELKDDETVERVFVDRDMSMWQGVDCNNWSVAPDFEIALDISSSLHFSWPAVDKTMCYQSATATDYIDHVGNAVPYKKAGDFPKPDALWTAACYQIGGHQRITGLSFELSYFMFCDGIIQMLTPDYTSPIGPPDEKYGHRFSRYPRISYWFDFYGLAGTKFPKPLYFGAYVCDAPEDLPTADPIAMRSDPHALIIIDYGACGLSWMSEGMGGTDPLKLRFPCDGKLAVFYATYLPVQLPFNLSTKYSQNADHLVRTKWVARNRVYNPFAGNDSNWIDVKNVSVYANGYESAADGSDDLAEVFTILFPTAVVDSMPLPAPIDDTAPTSIVLRNATTKLAAIPELLSLYPDDKCWGVWEDKVLTIEHHAGAVSIADEPGVDTTGAAASDEGAVDLVLVEFTPSLLKLPATGALRLASTSFLIVDLEGSYDLVEDGWEPAAGVRVAKIDATGYAHSEIAAARAGQMLAISRRREQWTGSVPLEAIAGASAIRPGDLLFAPSIDGALITQTTCDVGADSVSFSLGSTGYLGRFPARIPGKPLTASPYAKAPINSQSVRRSGGGRR